MTSGTLQEVEALERQLSSHDDRLSEDEEDDDSRQGDSLIHEPVSASDDTNTYLEQLDSDRNDGKSSAGEDSQRSWNVPDDEWQWSDEDGSSNTPSSSTSRVSNRPAAPGNSKRESSLKIPSRTTQKPAGCNHSSIVLAALCTQIAPKTGQLVVIQQLHHTPVISIKARIGTGKVSGEDEDEMTILHEGGKVVCIEGESLWVVLRLSNGSNRLSSPARHKPTLSNGFSSSSSSSMYTSQATERFMTFQSTLILSNLARHADGSQSDQRSLWIREINMGFYLATTRITGLRFFQWTGKPRSEATLWTRRCSGRNVWQCLFICNGAGDRSTRRFMAE
ncbi:hypothetical protein BG003_002585 [Podila horticola]|nr:hypothetical protein BG003_002585 [Podila horticola]